MVRDRKHPISPLRLQRAVQILKEVHHGMIAEGIEAAVKKFLIAYNVGKKILQLTGIGYVAASLSRNIYFFTKLFIFSSYMSCFIPL